MITDGPEEHAMARDPDPRPGPELFRGPALRDRLRALPPDRRQQLLRSIRRGQPVADERDAVLAVSAARRQQRTAQYSWLVVPAITFALWAVGSLPVTVAIIGTIIAGYVATLVLARSVRAERINRGVVQGTGSASGGTSDTTSADAPRVTARRRGHLPRRRP